MTKKAINKIIGYRIRLERKHLGLTQEQLAKKMRMSRISIVNIEAGRQDVPIFRLLRIGKIMNCTVMAFLRGL